MTLEKIIATYFPDVAESTDGALYQRLHDAAGKLLATLPHRSEFPAERELAAALGVNRNTLRRALAPYVSSGILRRSKKGTFVHKPESTAPEAVLPPAEPVHPFLRNAFRMAPLSRPRKLTVVLYENLPQQVEFWEECFERFEASSGVVIEAHWVNHVCTTQTEYHRLIQAKEADVFQMMEPSVDIDEMVQALLRRPSEETQRILAGPAYLANSFFALEDTARQWTTPFYFSPWVDVVNQELAEKFELELESVSAGYSLNRILRDAAARLPESIRITSHIGGLHLAHGFPIKMTRELLHRHYSRCVRSVWDLRERGETGLQLRLDDNFLWDASHTLAAFGAGKLLHMTIPSSFVRYWQPYWHFPVLTTLSGYDPANTLMLNGFSLGIRRESVQPELGEELLRFMLSEPIQRRLAAITGVIPMHRDAATDFLPELSATTKHREFILSHAREFSSLHRLWFWSGYNIGPILRQLLEGKCTLSSSIEAILDLQHQTVVSITGKNQ